jgi:putative transposase
MMAGFGFRKNSTFDWNGVTFRVREMTPNEELMIEAIHTGSVSVVAQQQLLAEYVQGRLSATPRASLEADGSAAYSRPLDELKPAAQDEVTRRLKYLRAIEAEGRPVFTRAYLDPLLLRISIEIGDKKPPGASTVYRWYRRHQSMGQDARTLVPRFDRRGPRSVAQDKRVLDLLADAVAEAFKASPLANAPNIHSRLITKVTLENAGRIGGEKLHVPSLRTTYRLLQHAEAYDLTILREGKAAADRRYKIVRFAVQPTAILERVEADHTPLDLFVIDERTWLPMGRPTLTVLIDKFSRFPLGYYLSFAAPSAAAVVGALRHAILPKTLNAAALPQMTFEKDWPCYGIPMRLVVDNGLEFHGKDLEGIATDLGMVIEYCPRRTPRFKGAIERFLKTINYFFAHQLPGASFARFHQRGDYDPQEQALITFAELKQILEKWIVDVYAETVHRGIGTTPRAQWTEGLKAYTPELPASPAALQLRIGQHARRRLRRTGIELNGLYYSGDGLQPILKRYGEGVEVRVVFDPDDLGEVQVWGPDDAEPVAVRAVDFSFANGLSVRQNELIRQTVRERGENAGDKAALQRGRAGIAATVETLMVHRKQKARHRSAAIRGISSAQPTGRIPDAAAPAQERPKQPVPKPKVAAGIEAPSIPAILKAFEMGPTEVLDEDQ